MTFIKLCPRHLKNRRDKERKYLEDHPEKTELTIAENLLIMGTESIDHCPDCRIMSQVVFK